MSKRFGRNQRRKMSARLRELEGDYDLSVGAVCAMREHTKAGLNMNCTFVDDEVRLLVALAQRAILVGVAEDAHPGTLRRMKEHVEQFRADHEAALGFPLVAAQPPEGARQDD